VELSIIIPTWNEELFVASAIQCCLKESKDVIVVDGGSTDRTVCLAHQYPVRVFQAPKGRASQMNFGAEKATHDVLMFVHADTRVPVEAHMDIEDAIESGNVGGRFRLQFDIKSPLLNLCAFLSRYDFAGLSFGDQGMFVTKSCFLKSGKFPVHRFPEDIFFYRSMKRLGKTVVLSKNVMTSARRFHKRGVLSQQILNIRILLMAFLGWDSKKIEELYCQS